jgi:hypothetical protein
LLNETSPFSPTVASWWHARLRSRTCHPVAGAQLATFPGGFSESLTQSIQPLTKLQRALLARAHGDEAAYREYRDRYRAMATSLCFEGHMAWAEARP